MDMKRRTCIIFFFIVTFVAALFCAVPCSAAASGERTEDPHVLFLSSYSYAWESVPKQLAGITDTLDGKASMDYIFMDTKHFEYDDAKGAVYKAVAMHKEKEPIDYVIAGDDAALHFVVDYREKLFSGIPVVFEGINDEDFAKKAAKDPLITGIVETFPLEKTIKLARDIDTEAKQIVGITDSTVSGKGSTKQFLECRKDFPGLKFSTFDCSKMTKKEIGEKIGSYRSNTILLYLIMTNDSEGNTYSNTEAVEYLEKYAKVPLYKADEVGIGSGIMGGVVISYHDMAAQAAKIVLELSRGEDISKYKVTTTGSFCLFDKEVMDRYKVSNKAVSLAYGGNVKFINEQKTYFQKHRSAIIPLATVILVLIAAVIFGIVYIRGRKKLMTQISDKDAMLNNVLDNMPGGVMILRQAKDPHEKVETLYFSQGIPKLSGHTEEEYRALVDDDLLNIGIDEEDIAEFQRALAVDVPKKKTVTMRFHQRHKNGSLIWVSMSAKWSHDDRDGGRVYYAFFLDVTQQEKMQAAENEVIAARASSEAKSEFLSRMSHDIRTPLNAIIGFESLALGEDDMPPAVREYLEKIDVSGRYLLGLVNDVLDMEKIESGKLEIHEESTDRLKMLNSIADVFGHQAAEKGIKLTADFSSLGEQWVIMDSLRTRQVYANLLSNAVKFSAFGSEIKWTVADTPAGDGKVMTISAVSDQGCGMSEEFMERMFMPFEQNSPTDAATGTGLGLPIVKNLIAMMGGTIGVESRPGKGTKFTVTLERKIGVPRAESKDSRDFSGAFKGCRVLLCEDNDINADITKRLLTKADCEMDRAENGRTGVDKFAASEPGYYDAVLMDVRMPVMDGLETASAMRALDRPDTKGIPIIALSANAFDEDVRKSLAAGMNAHLAKPIDPQELYETLMKFIGR